MKQIEIAPGAVLSYVSADKFKRCKIAIHLVVPNEREKATEYALLPNILTRDCEKISDPMELSRYLFELYGAEITSESYTAGTNRIITLGVSGLKSEHSMQGEDLEKDYIDLLCELLFAPKLQKGGFYAGEVEIEKEKQADYLRSEMNDKRSYCVKQARRRLFKDSPLGVESNGYIEDIAAITAQSLYEVYQEMLKIAQIEVVIVGVKPQKVARAIAARLADIERKPAGVEPFFALPNAANFESDQEVMDTVQGKLCILYTSGICADSQQFATMRVANAILGGLATSRLFTNVREKQSLCYYCVSSYAGKAGILTIESGIDHANREMAVKAISKEVEIMQEELVTEEEMKNAKDALMTSLVAAQDHISALEGWLFTERLYGTNLTIDEFATLVQNVTREQVRATMKKFVPALEYAIIGKEEK